MRERVLRDKAPLKGIAAAPSPRCAARAYVFLCCVFLLYNRNIVACACLISSLRKPWL